MSLSDLLIEPHVILVADASVVINLNATGLARSIISGFPNRWVVTTNVLAELVGGTGNGHVDAQHLQTLIDRGLIDLVCLGHSGNKIYETLIDGSAVSTLDDGEAATIAYAKEVGGIALIDERKAKTLCTYAFPNLLVVPTVQLLLHEASVRALGKQGQVDSLLSALQRARMRVPQELVGQVVQIIGEKNATECVSLPKWARTAS